MSRVVSLAKMESKDHFLSIMSLLPNKVNCHCEEHSDEAISIYEMISMSRLLRYARNDTTMAFGNTLIIYIM